MYNSKIKKCLKPDTFVAGEEGIEPPLTVLETAALPLYYSPMSSLTNCIVAHLYVFGK